MHLSRHKQSRTNGTMGGGAGNARTAGADHEEGGFVPVRRVNFRGRQTRFRAQKQAHNPRESSPYHSQTSTFQVRSQPSPFHINPVMGGHSKPKEQQTPPQAPQPSHATQSTETHSTQTTPPLQTTPQTAHPPRYSDIVQSSRGPKNSKSSKSSKSSAPIQLMKNPFLLEDSESEAEAEDQSQEQSQEVPEPVQNVKEEPQEQPTPAPPQPTSTRTVVSPLDILQPCRQSCEYPVETLEGLMLLGMIPMEPLDSSVTTILHKYAEKCKHIHQSYMDQYKKTRRPRNQSHRPYDGNNPRNGHNPRHNSSRNSRQRGPGGHGKGAGSNANMHGGNRRTHQHPHHSRNPNHTSNHNANHTTPTITGDDFAMIRDFKKTVIHRDEEGLAKTKSKIRSNLNKLTDKTYTKMMKNIKQEVDELVKSGANDEDYTELSAFIFQVACGNRFYGKLYADLFSALLDSYDFLKPAMNAQLHKFTETMKIMESLDSNKTPEENYDRFCEINKQNEKRRALASFMGHLLRVKCIDEDCIGESIYHLILQSTEWIQMESGTLEDNKRHVEEIAEVVFAFLESAGVRVVELNMWEPILKNCISISHMKRNPAHALSPKAKFKYMDILDMINKWKVEL